MDEEAKKRKIAEFIDGKLVDDSQRVAICIKGSQLGFPATVEAFRPSFPFGLNYYIETETEAERMKQGVVDPFQISVRPRFAKGIMSFLTRLFLFESRGQPVGSKKFEGKYISSYNDMETAERFIRYPGVEEAIDNLNQLTQFNDLVVRAKYGVYLSQSQSFNAADIDVVRETFKELAKLGQVLFDAF